jgi:hypothetical protein
VFERLSEDVDAVAALQGMQDVFTLRAADIYRVLDIEHVLAAAHLAPDLRAAATVASDSDSAAGLGVLTARLSRCPDLDTLVSATVDGLAGVFGYEHSLLLLLDEEGKRLYTIASKGYDVQGVGSEVTVGEGIIGMAAARCAPIRRMQDRDAADATQEGPAVSAQDPTKPSTHVHCFSVDGSTFLDGDYLIKGVSGRIMCSLLRHYDLEGRVEFTNREVPLDPTLELPEFRDNFESRLILLKRRLDERGAPIQIEKTGRGRFRLVVERPLRLEQV